MNLNLLLGLVVWWRGDEGLIGLTWIDDLAIKLIALVQTPGVPVAPISDIHTEAIIAGELVIPALGEGDHSRTLISVAVVVIVNCPFVGA